LVHPVPLSVPARLVRPRLTDLGVLVAVPIAKQQHMLALRVSLNNVAVTVEAVVERSSDPADKVVIAVDCELGLTALNQQSVVVAIDGNSYLGLPHTNGVAVTSNVERTLSTHDVELLVIVYQVHDYRI
jgi:hypothetical protein